MPSQKLGKGGGVGATGRGIQVNKCDCLFKVSGYSSKLSSVVAGYWYAAQLIYITRTSVTGKFTLGCITLILFQIEGNKDHSVIPQDQTLDTPICVHVFMLYHRQKK